MAKTKQTKALTISEKKARAEFVLAEMEKLFPDAKSELVSWETPFQFLICILLSAQTTDAMVNRVTEKLFAIYKTPEDFSRANVEDIIPIIRPVNYHRNKAKYVIATAKLVLEKFKGVVPKTVEELMTLPGIGLKTANVFLNDMYNANTGIGVDTHVLRVSHRLGLSDGKTPEAVAKDLQKLYPKDKWHIVNSCYVLYGRYYCKATVDPKTSKCVFKDICSWCGGGVKSY